VGAAESNRPICSGGKNMGESFDLTDIVDREEVEFYYKRTLTDDEWELICYNLRSKFWSKVRGEIRDALEDAPDFFIKAR
jgi:hypothetical protein